MRISGGQRPGRRRLTAEALATLPLGVCRQALSPCTRCAIPVEISRMQFSRLAQGLILHKYRQTGLCPHATDQVEVRVRMAGAGQQKKHNQDTRKKLLAQIRSGIGSLAGEYPYHRAL